MGIFSSVSKWFADSGVESQVKQAAVQELTKAANDFIAKVEAHAPDMVSTVENNVTTALATAVAGALTRTKA